MLHETLVVSDNPWQWSGAVYEILRLYDGCGIVEK